MFSLNAGNEENINLFEPILPHGSRLTFGAISESGSISKSTVNNANTEPDEDSCGEPFVGQHLVMDFTPNAEDSEYVQDKCNAFWQFIKKIPEIQSFMVYPEKRNQPPPKRSQETVSSATDDEVRSEKPDITAVSMLKLVHEGGMGTNAFHVKMPRTTCSIGSREYKELEEPPPRVPLKWKKKMAPMPMMPCQGRYNPCPFPCGDCCQPIRPTPVQTMVKQMEEWDAKHPKSMEPPSHPPSLQHCILQRSQGPKGK